MSNSGEHLARRCLSAATTLLCILACFVPSILLPKMSLAPFFDKPPSMLNRPDGSVLFECTCNSNPEPTVQWFFKDQELKDDRHVTKVKKMVGKYACTMIIKDPTLQDQGIYKVTATNKNGTHSVQQSYVLAQTANEVFKTS